MMTGKGNCGHSGSRATTASTEETLQRTKDAGINPSAGASSSSFVVNNNNTVKTSSPSTANHNHHPAESQKSSSSSSSSIHHSYMEGALIFIANSNTTTSTTNNKAAQYCSRSSATSTTSSSTAPASQQSQQQQPSSKLSTDRQSSLNKGSRKMVKEKPNSTRIYDQDGYRQRAACICVKNEDEAEVLMVSSSRNSDQWIFPGGGLEPDETATMAAIREVIEEAGVRGKLDRCLGTFENQERRHRTAVYVMIVTEELAEWDDARNIGRKRKWFSLDEAVEQLALHKPSHLNYLNHFRANSKRTHETDNGAEPT